MTTLRRKLLVRWRRFWLNRSGGEGLGRLSAWLACRHLGPYHPRSCLATRLARGFICPSSRVLTGDSRLGKHVFIGDRVNINRANDGGLVDLKDGVHIYGDSFLNTGMGGRIEIGHGSHIQPGCHIHAYIANIIIGSKVEIAPCCAFYSYDHGINHGSYIMNQPLKSKGDIIVGDGAWIGHGVIILNGVKIGGGAVIAAGSVVVHDIPDYAIAVGNPARIIKYRYNNSSCRTVTPSILR